MRAAIATGGLSGVLAGVLGCGGLGAFACENDVQCLSDGLVGTCEPGGHCSFEDGECPSGRRYGDHAPTGTANTCVPVEADSTSDVAGTSDVAEAEDSTTTSPGPTSSADDDAVSDDDGSTSGPIGEDSSTGAIEGCAVVLDDDFADASFADDWVASDPAVSQHKGQLWVPIDTTFASQKYVIAAETYDLVGGSYTVELGTLPDSSLPVVWVDVEDAGHRVQFVLIGQDLRLRMIVDNQDITDFMIVDHDPVAHRFVRLGFEAGDMVHWSVSPDGAAWVELHARAIPLDASAARVRLAAGNWSDLAEPQVVGYERATVCVAPR